MFCGLILRLWKEWMPSHNNKGRNKTGGRFVMLPHWLMNSAAFKALRPVERCVLIEVCKRYNGTNNGSIHVSNRELGDELHVSKTTAGRALKRLVHIGFLEITVKGSFSQKINQATEYRLTHEKCDRTQNLSNKAFMSWRPESA